MWLRSGNPSGLQGEVHPAALPLDLVDFAFAVVVAAGLEGEHFHISRQALQALQQFSYGHAPSVATRTRYVDEGTTSGGASVMIDRLLPLFFEHMFVYPTGHASMGSTRSHPG